MPPLFITVLMASVITVPEFLVTFNGPALATLPGDRTVLSASLRGWGTGA